MIACSKDKNKPALAAGSVSIQTAPGKDTLLKALSTERDTLLLVGLHAMLPEGQKASADHIVTFQTDSTRMASYRAKYGAATLLPLTSYVFYRNQARIPAGGSVSDSIQLNLVKQTALKPEMTYVLPVVIRNVDGNVDAVQEQVLYIVVKTDKPSVTNKSAWSIVSVSSQLNANTRPQHLLDNDDQNTAWASASAPMPQYVVIDLGTVHDFTGVSYRSPDAYYAPSLGGYPLKVKIEVSTDNINWTDKGTYDGRTTPGLWSQQIGATTARYLKFSVLEAALFQGGIMSIVLIGGIYVIP